MANFELCRTASLVAPFAASLKPLIERSVIVFASPVRKSQRGSLRTLDAYVCSAAGVSRSGSTLIETKRTGASLSILVVIRRIVAAIIGHVPAQLVNMKS